MPYSVTLDWAWAALLQAATAAAANTVRAMNWVLMMFLGLLCG